LGDPVPHTAGDGYNVFLEFHASATTYTQSTSSQITINIGSGNLNACRHTFNDRDEGRPVRLTCR
jgi:hypothetical protein